MKILAIFLIITCSAGAVLCAYATARFIEAQSACGALVTLMGFLWLCRIVLIVVGDKGKHW